MYLQIFLTNSNFWHLLINKAEWSSSAELLYNWVAIVNTNVLYTQVDLECSHKKIGIWGNVYVN